MPVVDHHLSRITTPLRLKAWMHKLKSHPDQDFAHFIVHGIEHGFPIGVDGSARIVAATRNMLSSAQNPEVIERYIQEKWKKAIYSGPSCPVPSDHFI